MKTDIKTITACNWIFRNLLLSLLILPAVAFADVQLQFEWDPNVEPDIAGYRVFDREDGQAYDYSNPAWEGEETFCSVSVAETETRYFVVRAFDCDGFESDDSNEVMYAGSEASGNYHYQRKDNSGSDADALGEFEDSGCFIAAAY